MIAFMKSMDNKTWKAFIKGWSHPMVNAQDGINLSSHKQVGPTMKIMNLMEIVMLSIQFSMELTKMFFLLSTQVLNLNKLKRFSKLYMKELQTFICHDFNFSPPSLIT